MAKPRRNASPNQILGSSRTFFVTTNTSMGRALSQSERNAMLFIDVLRSYVKTKKFQVHDFVVMPDHVHLLITVKDDMTIEKALQFIKGGFSFRLKKETGYAREVWRRGFSETRVNDHQSYKNHREYIAQNPVNAGLIRSAEEFPFSFSALTKAKGSRTERHPKELFSGPDFPGTGDLCQQDARA